MTNDQRWICAGWLILLATALLSASHWPIYPYFVDSYYHLSVIEGFRAAGGPVLQAVWEAAPEGRPHLYPPLFHLLFLPARMAGIPAITLARFWTWASFPLLLLSVWFVLRRLTTPRLAALTLIALVTPYSFFLGSINYVPATLTLIFAMGILLALARQRWLAGGLLLALVFWTHAGFSWLLTLSLILFGLFSREHRKTAWICVGIGILGGSPWLLHLARQTSHFKFAPRGEERFIELSILPLTLAFFGAVLAWKKGGIYRFWVALALGFLPMLAGYRFRFFAAQGLFPLLLLTGIALDWAAGRLLRGKWLAAALAAMALLAPTLHTSPAGAKMVWADTTGAVLSGAVTPAYRGTGNPLYHTRLISPLVKAVQAHTQRDELIFCNLPYLGIMLGVLSDRASSSPLLREMGDSPQADQIRPARLVIWVKDPSGSPTLEMQGIVLQHHLRPLGETELAYLFLNPYGEGKRRAPRAVCPWWLALGAFGLVFGLAVRDLRRPA